MYSQIEKDRMYIGPGDIYQRVALYVGMAATPINNKCKSSELSNAAPVSRFRHITWSTTLKGGKIRCYNDIREIVKTRTSPSSSSSGLAQNWYLS